MRTILPKDFSFGSISPEQSVANKIKGIEYASLYNIFTYLTTEMTKIVDKFQFNIIVPEVILYTDLNEASKASCNTNISKNVSIKTGATKIGDIVVSKQKLTDIFTNSTTLMNFTKNLLTYINNERRQGISLESKVIPPAGMRMAIINKAQLLPFNEKNSIEKYLKIDCKSKNNIIKSFGISKDLENSKDLQNYIEILGGENMSDDLLKAALL
jgi:hypothetical protein